MPDANRETLFGGDSGTEVDVTRGLVIDRVFSNEGRRSVRFCDMGAPRRLHQESYG